MTNWLIVPIRRMTDFKGRSRRREFWIFSLALFALWIALFALADTLFPMAEQQAGEALVEDAPPLSEDANTFLMWVGLPLFLFFGWVHLALSIRRLHDTGRSGWWYLVVLIPWIGTIVGLIWFLQDGQPFETIYGEDPKGREPPPPRRDPEFDYIPPPAAPVRRD